MSLTGKVALVTGASRGIGRAIALELGKMGATVAGTSTSEDGATAITELFAKSAIKGSGYCLDVGSTEAVDAVLARIEQEFGAAPLILVNNAGITRDNLLMRMKAGTQAIRALLYLASGYVDRATLGEAGAQDMVDLLTPLAKTYGTDMGSEIASLGIQVHGGMGFVEETGAAQYYRDIRIAAIYEGTNGIQAADLVGRKLAMQGGDVIRNHLSAISADAAGHSGLLALAAANAEVTEYMLGAEVDDRLAGSYAYTNMMAVVTSGWLKMKQSRAAQAEITNGNTSAFLRSKVAACRYYLDVMVPEALAFKATAMAGAELLYALDAEELAA
jgi:NAD(P)-dependent dehydrogenase (short-subunit alcohol dehydrogenase family)